MTDASGAHGQRAGIVSRTTAAAIDAVLVGVLCGLVLLLYALGDFLLTGLPFRIPDLPRPGGFVGVFVTALAYLTCGWAMAGRSPGKQVVGLRVVSAVGRPLPPGRAWLRAVLCLLFPVGLGWALVSRRNASVQDLLLRTVVLYDWGPRDGPHPH